MIEVALIALAQVAPVEGRLVFSAFPLVGTSFSANVGLEGEIGPRAGIFAVGASAWALGDPTWAAGPLGGEYSATAYARARFAVTGEDEVSALVGHNHRHQGPGGHCGEVCAPPDSGWLVLGLAWQHQTDRYWVRLTPQYAISWDPRFTSVAGGWVSEALPLVEGGFWVTPSLGVGARFGPGITQLVWRF